MNRNADTIRVATWVAGEFSIYTTNPSRLAAFARDALASGREWLAAQHLLVESLERVSHW